MIHKIGNIFYVDIGNMPVEQAAEFIKTFVTQRTKSKMV